MIKVANELKFDLSKLTGRVMSRLSKAEKTMDMEVIAETLALVVVSLPASDAPNSPDTYLDMPLVESMKLLRGLGEAIKGELLA